MNQTMRRSDRALSREEALEILDRAGYCTVAMHGADGWPYAVALSCVRVGDNLFFHSAHDGFKCLSLHGDNRVCVSAVSDQVVLPGTLTVKYHSAVAFGTAFKVTDPDERRAAFLAITNHFDPDNPTAPESAEHCERAAIYGIHLLEVTGKAND